MQIITIILFGVTGDLAKRKLLPALYYLVKHHKLQHFIIIGVGKEASSVEEIYNNAKPFIENIDQSVVHQLCSHTHYFQIDIGQHSSFDQLSTFVRQHEQHTQANRLFYLALPAHLFGDVTEQLHRVGLLARDDKITAPWQRVVFEKPFGTDLKSAQQINNQIARVIDESQIYRMDHYLTKELVSNIALVRFTNAFFEPLWNFQYIDQVHIILDETVNVAQRGAFYDQYGAIKDVVQNHMLQLLALVAMEQPNRLTSEDIRTARLEVLEQVEFIDGMRGQYEGYQQEKEVNPDSTTETFALLRLAVNNARWKGVPFIVRTGKALSAQKVSIDIKFKNVDCLLLRGCPLQSNWLRFTLAPQATFGLQLNIKKPDTQDVVMPIDMNFCHSCVYGMRSSQAYEVLLEQVLQGQQLSAVSAPEIEASWKLIDHILAQKLPLYTYNKESGGPTQMKMFAQKWNIQWHHQ